MNPYSKQTQSNPIIVLNAVEEFPFKPALIKLKSLVCFSMKGVIMRKAVVFTVLFVLAAGCTSSLDRVRAANRRNLLKLSVGMPKEQALVIMGHESGGGRFGEPTVNSPYKSEILPSGDKTFEVLYYYTDVKSVIYTANPATIADDELTPLVFENGKLIGWGTDFMENIKNKNN
jgi:hypothetical protein